jgi:hypothetical protein
MTKGDLETPFLGKAGRRLINWRLVSSVSDGRLVCVSIAPDCTTRRMRSLYTTLDHGTGYVADKTGPEASFNDSCSMATLEPKDCSGRLSSRCI